ncbi:hypothetical protein DRE_07608 [Drechslerella stenobrocha 248]|uniref:Fido domain-containing protein n=1 Tax=Drechslerella stenobrocha 248 TaxID=1043628 RepID=W7HSG5_9PEZI|nr:hypothetical protein DRE_07608 [Drechslerella stenobrocha 248]
MASEYEAVRWRILSGRGAGRPSSALSPLATMNPPPASSSSTSANPSQPTNLPLLISTSFIETLANHVKTLSEARISKGFLHLHPAPIHRSRYLADPPQQYQHITDLLRRIDINLFNISPFKLQTFLSSLLTRLVHDSTRLSRTGTDLPTTQRICAAIFAGAGITELNLPNTPGFHSEVDAVARQQGRTTVALAGVLRAREQVVHYTNALAYFIQWVVCESGELTTELLRDTHRILTRAHEPVDGMPCEPFGGRYRDYQLVSDVVIGSHENDSVYDSNDDNDTETITPTTPRNLHSRASDTTDLSRAGSIYHDVAEEPHSGPTPLRESIDPREVEAYTAKLIDTYHAQLSLDRHSRQADNVAECTLSDPFALTAWLCSEFLHVRPFVAGNEEISRIMLTGILLRELGVAAVIGRDDGDGEAGRAEYTEILERCQQRHGTTEGEDGGSYAEFAGLVVRRATACVEDLAAVVGSS